MVTSDQLYVLVALPLGKVLRVSTRLRLNGPQTQSVYKGKIKKALLLTKSKVSGLAHIQSMY
jgi:hypothetical protein